LRQPQGEPTGDLAQKHVGLGERVQKPHGLVGPQVGTTVVRGLGQRVQHTPGKPGRGKDFVVRQVGNAGQHRDCVRAG
jgi:hypothetical protein